ncbi:MAG TPA: VOC family protein [Bryobacteraceae bacterium]
MIDKEMTTTMNDVNVLHHVGIISRDMGAVIEQYQRLGFTFAPLTLPRIPLEAGAEPKPIGVGNRCAIFENNYLEILAVTDEARWGAVTREQRGPF